MLSSNIFDGLELEDVLREYLAGLDDYDEPYFISIKLNICSESAIKMLIPKLDHLDDDIYAFKLDKQLLLLSLECEVDEVKSLANILLSAFAENDVIAQIAVFHHNCLGTPIDTFKWSTQLLEELIDKSPSESAVEFNDFSDRSNWPGLSAYVEGRDPDFGADISYHYDESDEDDDFDDDDDDRFDENGFDEKGFNESGFTALIQAILDDDCAAVRRQLLAGEDVNKLDWYNNTPLNHAVKSSTPEIVSLLLEAGANPNQVGSYGTTALYIASYNGMLSTIRQLLSKGADVNGTVDEGESSLMAAAGNSTAEVVAVLLQAGADINALSENGNTALIHAVMARYSERKAIVELLLANGAVETINHANMHNSTAMDLVFDYEHHELIDILAGAMSEAGLKPSHLTAELA
ncbi:ankyrin repeat domain-containing protein [Shewanella pneumatophori]|uniref:Ankyrin repeat domain-containing protein n=1 Tax=Shewanella pneumatophori TaxID=314092 RepID=A0A9X2CGW9_9GAMM|nr:ankyrin repeat domain-containing protein [Shewanella pneumatophori]MCL1137870.1 ankyrin repeat domain-containing protein [Shewanella pneumatophori]